MEIRSEIYSDYFYNNGIRSPDQARSADDSSLRVFQQVTVYYDSPKAPSGTEPGKPSVQGNLTFGEDGTYALSYNGTVPVEVKSAPREPRTKKDAGIKPFDGLLDLLGH
ncbi:hypothetical protein LL06_25380 [Hoeflea sp. BAL378]|uniref:hypothetical protein n=1 Tax=Hoeflea sp. BAL378 TaxID=1547437 RepID=UPI00051375DC|nr:hypothetical protein [Hoeflea sp. BAL378]KGF66884.1 hypothetical protein LL06_25380 [Hoeflea sp. BAL378]